MEADMMLFVLGDANPSSILSLSLFDGRVLVFEGRMMLFQAFGLSLYKKILLGFLLCKLLLTVKRDRAQAFCPTYFLKYSSAYELNHTELSNLLLLK